MKLTLEWIGSGTHMSFDMDSMDSEWAPSTGFPVPGGLSLHESKCIAEKVYQSGNLVSLDLVEINPQLEKAGANKTVQAGISVLLPALGLTS